MESRKPLSPRAEPGEHGGVAPRPPGEPPPSAREARHDPRAGPPGPALQPGGPGRPDDPPPLPTVSEVEEDLQPPVPRDLGRSIANLVLRTLVAGTAGALVGVVRGRAGPSDGPKPREG